MQQKGQMERWRLILGAETEQDFTNMGMSSLSHDQLLMDQALAEIY